MTVQEQAVVQEIAEVIAEMRGAAVDPLAADFGEMNLIIQGKLDSLDFINLLFRLEERHGIKIPEEDIDSRSLVVVKNLARYVAEAKR